jgi:hypothetical protein
MNGGAQVESAQKMAARCLQRVVLLAIFFFWCADELRQADLATLNES